MNTASRTLGIGLALCTLLSLSAPFATAAPTKARASAVSGEKIHRHPAGFTFAYPSGWSVEPGEGGALQLVPADRDPLEALLILADATSGIRRADDPRVAEQVEANLTQLFPFLQRVGRVERVTTGMGPGVCLAWEGVSPTEVAVRAEAYLVIAGESAAELLAVGPRERLAQRSSHVRRVFASFAPDRPGSASRSLRSGTVLRAPAPKSKSTRTTHGARVDRSTPGTARSSPGEQSPLVREWKQRLGGKKLVYLSSYSSGTSGGYNSRYDLTLNADGTFVFQGSSTVSVYVPGTTGSSVGQESSTGSWRLFVHEGQAVLELKSAGKQPEQFRLTYQDGKTYLNGRRFFVTEP